MQLRKDLYKNIFKLIRLVHANLVKKEEEKRRKNDEGQTEKEEEVLRFPPSRQSH